MNRNSLLLGLFQDQSTDLHFPLCIKKIASTFVLLCQEQDASHQLLLSQQQLDGYSLQCVKSWTSHVGINNSQELQTK